MPPARELAGINTAAQLSGVLRKTVAAFAPPTIGVHVLQAAAAGWTSQQLESQAVGQERRQQGMRIGRVAINVLLGGTKKQGATPSAASLRARRTNIKCSWVSTRRSIGRIGKAVVDNHLKSSLL
jgi:hypothetical protein